MNAVGMAETYVMFYLSSKYEPLSSTLHVCFNDGSELQFEVLAEQPHPRSYSSVGSIARQVGSDVSGLKLAPGHVTLVFVDESEWTLAVTTSN